MYIEEFMDTIEEPLAEKEYVAQDEKGRRRHRRARLQNRYFLYDNGYVQTFRDEINVIKSRDED